MKLNLKLTIASILSLGSILTSTVAYTSEVFPPAVGSNANQPRQIKKISPFISNQNKNATEISPIETDAKETATTEDLTRNIYQCVNYENKPTTIVDTARGRIKLIVWESQYFANSGWSPQKRCEAVSARFQKFSDDRSLKYVSTGIMNRKYKVICVSRPRPGRGYACNDDGLLITLQPNDNPSAVLKNLFVNASKLGGTAVVRGETAVSIDTILNKAEIISTENNEIEVVEQKVENKANQMPQLNPPRVRGRKSPQKTNSICQPPLCN